ncbi:MAG: substrate-binding domain-containing protein, partial [Planctomycetaceae bacterium]
SVYDSNAAILGAAIEELGGEPVHLGIVPDDEARLEAALGQALQQDVVVLSGGTSKGAGDLSYRIVARLGAPGIVAHGVALKPGKPICLAVVNGKPMVILPGFPTSAIFTFHEFVAPVIRALGGQPLERRDTVRATLPMRVNSQRGRTEYLLVSLLQRAGGLAAYPMGKGSGSVTTFSQADGFITIDQHTEILPEGRDVEVTLLDREIAPADLAVVTSHCVGLDLLLSRLVERGFRVKSMNVGSSGALAATRRGECDLAGIHLLDAATGEYNRPFVDAAGEAVELVPGYGRMQCLVFRAGDGRFAGRSANDALAAALGDPQCRLVNRNPGSGTRMLLDRLLASVRETVSGPGEPSAPLPSGYGVQVRSHNAVCAAVKDGRADWGVAIDIVARMYELATIPLQEERFDFVIPRSRRTRPAVQAFVELLNDAAVQAELRSLGFLP